MRGGAERPLLFFDMESEYLLRIENENYHLHLKSEIEIHHHQPENEIENDCYQVKDENEIGCMKMRVSTYHSEMKTEMRVSTYHSEMKVRIISTKSKMKMRVSTHFCEINSATDHLWRIREFQNELDTCPKVEYSIHCQAGKGSQPRSLRRPHVLLCLFRYHARDVRPARAA